MKKSKQLTGIEVFDIETGKIIGRVKDTIFQPGDKKIFGFFINTGRWIKCGKILRTEDIYIIGSDAILVRGCHKLVGTDKIPDYINKVREKKRVLGLKLITSDGEELGYIEDIIINEKNCSIEGYVLTDGILEDILKGKSVIPSTDEIIFGEDTVIINSKCKNIVLKNDISIRKALKKTGEKDTK